MTKHTQKKKQQQQIKKKYVRTDIEWEYNKVEYPNVEGVIK